MKQTNFEVAALRLQKYVLGFVLVVVALLATNSVSAQAYASSKNPNPANYRDVATAISNLTAYRANMFSQAPNFPNPTPVQKAEYSVRGTYATTALQLLNNGATVAAADQAALEAVGTLINNLIAADPDNGLPQGSNVDAALANARLNVTF